MIEGLDAAAQVEGVEIFHAGTTTVADGERILANGGRVLNVCATRQDRARGAGARLSGGRPDRWPDGFCRRDIGWRAVERENLRVMGELVPAIRRASIGCAVDRFADEDG